jgi:hypothetical protein
MFWTTPSKTWYTSFKFMAIELLKKNKKLWRLKIPFFSFLIYIHLKADISNSNKLYVIKLLNLMQLIPVIGRSGLPHSPIPSKYVLQNSLHRIDFTFIHFYKNRKKTTYWCGFYQAFKWNCSSIFCAAGCSNNRCL